MFNWLANWLFAIWKEYNTQENLLNWYHIFWIEVKVKMYIVYLSRTWSVRIILYSFLYVWLALWRIIACLSFKWLWRHFVDPVVFNKAEQCIHLPCFEARFSKKWFHTSDRLVIETSSNPPTLSYPKTLMIISWHV